ncbi:hypothetical protein [Leptospira adleri]|uniref:Uncharacterized protein n=1 Tax=Leptospira adleri TaxID=2023186 RepID=A0A2M9YJ27_9LEPT|nr:hypothetical protein [Leptospira adleri]PJZ51542.1 hypothetical protein CH380_19865 [Leptospira adleri]PJZ60265.1 hypothetical protein CH376_19385 [Leptospira adleri]
MGEFNKLSEVEDKDMQNYLGLIGTIAMILTQILRWGLKKFKEKRKLRSLKNLEPYPVTSPYFRSIREVTRLDIYFDRNLTTKSSDTLCQDLISLYTKAKENRLESIKIEFAHYGSISSAGSSALQKFTDYVSEFNGIRLVIKFPTDSPDAVKLYLDLQRHRAGFDSGRIELYLNDYTEYVKNHEL